MANYKDEDVFKILLATDCHLGYQENDPLRGNDALTTFEEILSIATEKQVDFILLGGDLFHENKPSRKILHGCMSLLRKYCMGDRPIQFEFLSDQSENFKHCPHPVVNFEDPNLNISMPVFSIHGNHDDPAGSGCLCTLDLLSLSGLVNYFGKCTDLENISILPLMLQKGKTKLCLYGLGSVRDERLHRMFLNGKVSMLRPREKCEEWFNIMVLHQNRVKHGAKNYIPEQFLDDFLDLVIWGHEHECRIDREWNEQQSFYVTQPGSSVATSLCHGEAVQKHVGLLQVRGREFQITKIPLQTVRQFYIKDIDLEETSLDLHSTDCQDKVMEYCKELVDQFIEKAQEEHTGHPKQPKQPLVRLRLFYPATFEPFSVHRFGHSFVSRVANSKDVVLFSRKKTEKKKAVDGVDSDILTAVMRQEGVDRQRVEDLVKKYFEQTDQGKQLLVLSEAGLSSAVQEYVDKEVKEAIGALVDHQMKKTQTHLKQSVRDPEGIDEELVRFKEERRRNSQNETREFSVVMQKTRATAKMSDDDMFEEEVVYAPSPPKRGRGRGRSTTREFSAVMYKTKRGTAKVNDDDNDIFEEEVVEAPPPPKRGRGRGRSTTRRKAPAKNEESTRHTRTSTRQTDLGSFIRKNNSYVNVSDSDDEDSKQCKMTSKRGRGVVFDFSD